MAVYDARPSAFTQLTTTADWEAFVSAIGGISAIDYSVGNAFTPSLDTPGRNAVMADGNIVIKGQLWRCDAPVSTAIPAASAQNRIDRLVLRLTRGATTSPTVIQPVVITGTPSGSPVEPPLVQTTTGIWDYPISSWTSTSAGAITTLVDEREQGPTFNASRNGLVAFKPADTSRANNITLTDDLDLKIGLAGNSVYSVNVELQFGCAANSVNISETFTIPPGASGECNKTYWTGATTQQTALSDTWVAARSPFIDNTRDWGMTIGGTIFTTNAGFLTLQWCQGTSSATATILRKGSKIVATPIG